VTLQATLQCPCHGAFLEAAFEYDAPPQLETRFDLGDQCYRRGYDRCAACDHWFGRHDLDLTQLYSADYVNATYGNSDGLRQRFEKIMALSPECSDNRQRVARLRAFAREHGINEAARPTLLDVGAGLGVFPAAMREGGWAVSALEMDIRMVKHLRTVVQIEARAEDLLIQPVNEAGYDAITFNKVLEHVEDPLPMVVHAARMVSGRGFVYIELPDVAAASEGSGREEFFIEHHHVFSPASIAMLFERAGLTPLIIERLREPSGKFTLRGFGTPVVACAKHSPS
jgi:SAM-dependent methyltransferase